MKRIIVCIVVAASLLMAQGGVGNDLVLTKSVGDAAALEADAPSQQDSDPLAMNCHACAHQLAIEVPPLGMLASSGPESGDLRVVVAEPESNLVGPLLEPPSLA